MRLVHPLLAAAALAVSTLPVAAQTASIDVPAGSRGSYHLGLLNESQRTELMHRIDRYAVVEAFLRACGRAPALERQVRRAVTGCIRQDSIETLAGHYRRAVATRANLRWDCVSAGGRQMIEKSETAIRLTVAELTQLCRRD